MTATVDESRIRELKQHLATKAEEIKGLSNSWKDEDGKFVLSKDDNAKYVNAIEDAKQIKKLLTAEVEAKGIFEFLDAPEGTAAAAADAADRRSSVKSLGAAWLESEQYKAAKATEFSELPRQFKLEQGLPTLTSAAAKDVYSAMGGSVEIPSLGSAQALGFTERTLRPGRVRDLFPAERTEAAMLYGIRETGYANRAAVVPERTAANGTDPATGGPTDVYGLKPKSELTIVPVSYPIATIAHIMYAHKNTLDDEPRMRGILDRDMVDGVKMTEDAQTPVGRRRRRQPDRSDEHLRHPDLPRREHRPEVGADPSRRDPRDPRLLPADRRRDAPVRLGRHRAGDRPERRSTPWQSVSPSAARSASGASTSSTPRRCRRARLSWVRSGPAPSCTTASRSTSW